MFCDISPFSSSSFVSYTSFGTTDSHAIQTQLYADLEEETLQLEQQEREMRQLEVNLHVVSLSHCGLFLVLCMQCVLILVTLFFPFNFLLISV